MSGSSDQFHIVTYFIKCVTTSWTHSKMQRTKPWYLYKIGAQDMLHTYEVNQVLSEQ